MCVIFNQLRGHIRGRSQKIERMPYIHLPAYLFDHYPSEKAGH